LQQSPHIFFELAVFIGNRGGPVYSKERKEHDNANVLLQSFSGIVENTYAIFRVTFLPLFLHQVA